MRSARLIPLFGVLFLLALFYARLAGFPLQDPDEGRYASIPLEMLLRGDWLTPRLAGIPYFEKPPLFYWLVALSYEILGPSEFATRAVSATAALLTVLMVYGFGRRFLSRRAALLAAGILATMPLFFVLSQAAVIDMVLTACFAGTLLAFFTALDAPPGERAPWIVIVAISTALGVLAKGLVALVLCGAIGLAALLLLRDWTMFRALLRPLPLLIFLAVAAPWFVLISLEHPVFPHYFFVEQHFYRYLDAAGHNIPHAEGPFFYVPVLLVTALPWTLVPILLATTRAGRGAFGILRRDLLFYLLLWAGTVFLFFSASSSKLPTYLLPMFPPLALVLGAWLDAAIDEDAGSERLVNFLFAPVLLLGLLLVPVALVAWPFSSSIAGAVKSSEADFAAIRSGVLWGGLAALAGGLARRRARSLGRALPVDLLMLLVVTLGATELGAVGARAVAKSGIHAARVVNAEARPGDIVVFYHQLSQSFGFYRGLGAAQNGSGDVPVIHVDDFGELAELADLLPEEQRDKLLWHGLDDLRAAWVRPGQRVFLYVDERELEQLGPELGSAPRILGRNRRRVLVDNRGPQAAARVGAGNVPPGPAGRAAEPLAGE